MTSRTPPAHGREEPPQLLAEDVLARANWRMRENTDAGLGAAIERTPEASMKRRIARAVRTPVVAGVLVFTLAVVVSIGIAVTSSLGAQLPDGATGGNAEVEGPAGASRAVDLGDGTGHSREGESAMNSSTDGDVIFVHVVGAVKSAGVVELRSGSRVQDALAAAGGATDEAVLAGINLARTVVDGEQLFVPDAETIAAGEGTPASAPAGANAPGTMGGTEASDPGGIVNINSADETLLATLPRVGPALAQRIIDWRELNGGFSSVEQLLEVSGIGERTLDGFRDRVTV